MSKLWAINAKEDNHYIAGAFLQYPIKKDLEKTEKQKPESHFLKVLQGCWESLAQKGKEGEKVAKNVEKYWFS